MSASTLLQQEGTFSSPAPTPTHLSIGRCRVPPDVLRYIVQLAYVLPPPDAPLMSVVPFSQITVSTGCDILTICSLRRVCKVLKNVVDGCRSLRSSVVVVLPLLPPSHFEEGHHDPWLEKPWHPSHITGFLEGLDRSQNADVRLFLQGALEGLSPIERIATLKELRPLLKRAASLHCHGYDARQMFDRAVAFPLLTFALPRLTTLTLDNCAFRYDNAYSIKPFLALLNRLPQLTTLAVSQIVAASPEEGTTAHGNMNDPGLDVVSMPYLRNVDLIGDVSLVAQLLLRLKTPHPINVSVDPREPSIEVVWTDPITYYFPAIDSIRLIGPTALDITLLSPFIQGAESLTLHETTLTDGHWATLSGLDFALPIQLNLVHCTFDADDLKFLYARSSTAIFFRSPLSFLKVEDCSLVYHGRDSLIRWLKDHVERFFWDDMEGPAIDHTRSITVLAHESGRSVAVEDLSPEDFAEDSEDFVNWNDLSEEEGDSPTPTPSVDCATPVADDLTTDAHLVVLGERKEVPDVVYEQDDEEDRCAEEEGTPARTIEFSATDGLRKEHEE